MVDLPIWPSADYSATEDRWEQMVSSWFEDGIVPFDGSGLFKPYGDSSGMVAKVVGDASALLRGFFLDTEDSLISLTVDASTANPRWDRIVLRLETGGLSAKGRLILKKGTPAASNPAIPSLEVTDTVLEMAVGRVWVGGGALTITAGDVYDERTFSHSRLALPVGSVIQFYGSTAPEGFLAMSGQAVNTSDYPVLARLWGITVSTMTIPDMSGLVPRGASGSLGAIGGADTVTLSTANMPTHSHTVSGTWSGGNHSHTFTGDSHSHSASQPAHGHGVSDPGHKHGIGGDMGNRIVVTASSALRLATGSTPGAANEVSWTSMDAVGTGISIQASQPGITVNATTATGTVGASGGLSGSITGSTDSIGSGSAVNIVPRHRQLLFIIKAA